MPNKTYSKMLLVIFMLSAATVLIAWSVFSNQSSSNASKPEVSNKTLRPNSQIILGENIFDAQIVSSPSQKSAGLSNIASIKDDQAMVFNFAGKNLKPSFWMKDMLFDIDIIWIKYGRVVEIDSDLKTPKPNSTDESLNLYQPESAIDYAVEVNSGVSGKINLKIGDKFEILQ